MSTPQNSPENATAQLAALLVARIGPLAEAADRAKGEIASDRARYAGAGEKDALIDSVVQRVDELEADCRRLMRILGGFEAVATTPDASAPAVQETAVAPPFQPTPGPEASVQAEPAVQVTERPVAPPPSAEPPTFAEPAPAAAPVAATPVVPAEPVPTEEPPNVTTYSGTGADPVPASVQPPANDPAAAAPPTGAPVVPDFQSAPDPLGMPPPVGAPLGAAPSAAPPVESGQDAEDQTGFEGEDEPVRVSEGVRLLATQMSVAGASSADIARRLHNDFGVQDADRLIAHLFGPGR
jgi:hypothetical protein